MKVSEKLGQCQILHPLESSFELRKANRLSAVHSSLAIEGNTLTFEQVEKLYDHIPVLGPQRDQIECKNALSVYETLETLDPYSLDSFLKAHAMMMQGLIAQPGELRKSQVGIKKGGRVVHMAPPSDRVEWLMKDLFNYAYHSSDHLVIKSCVVHYELEFIHPFCDGNGRMGRLWQTLLLYKYNALFEYIPVESIIKMHQDQYYEVLEQCDNEGSSTKFIEFMLQSIVSSLDMLIGSCKQVTLNYQDRIIIFKNNFVGKFFTRKDYLAYFKTISSATASRDLSKAVLAGIVIKEGAFNSSHYYFSDKH